MQIVDTYVGIAHCEGRRPLGARQRIHRWIIAEINPRPTGGGGYFEPTSRFLAISSEPMQVSPPNLQYPLSQHFYTLC